MSVAKTSPASHLDRRDRMSWVIDRGPTPKSRKRNLRTLLGTATIVMLAVLSGLGIGLGTAPRPSVAGPSPSRVSLTDVSAQLTPEQQAFVMTLPVKYALDHCSPWFESPPEGALVAVVCGSSADQLTSSGLYARFPDKAPLDSYWKFAGGPINTVDKCPGGGDSPGDWNWKTTPDVTAGSIACGYTSDKRYPEVDWTNNTTLTYYGIHGPLDSDLASLVKYWQNLVL